MIDNEKLYTYELMLQELADLQRQLGVIEMEIMQEIDARGGTSLPNADENGEQLFICEIEETFTYDHSFFTPLLEKFNRTELGICYEPEHEQTVTVPAKWHTQQVKAVAKKHGDGAVEIVERGKIPKSRKLKFRRA
jgi:hypothetical protein